MHVAYVRGELGGFFSSHLFFILHPVSWDMADVCDLLRSLALLAAVRSRNPFVENAQKISSPIRPAGGNFCPRVVHNSLYSGFSDLLAVCFMFS